MDKRENKRGAGRSKSIFTRLFHHEEKSRKNSVVLEDLQKKTLPPLFAERVLGLELELESSGQVSVDVINQLVQLYSAAIEFYSSLEDKRYLVFKNKLANLLGRQTVQEEISRDRMSSKKGNSRLTTEEDHRRQKLMDKQEFNEVLSRSEKSTQVVVQSLVESYAKEWEKCCALVVKDIERQERAILQRLETRRSKQQKAKEQESKKRLQSHSRLDGNVSPVRSLPRAPRAQRES
eukprot:TRINITY_DN10903_c0_g1_i1.p1 TRINITY_DN10903_c0_g1~~TRINITY_DN10903_c0_g1_i1.p1  ORF type:complete len:235 (+),score=49.98 TRINITY_DN10903_c0_g1_i1:131-835(+)